MNSNITHQRFHINSCLRMKWDRCIILKPLPFLFICEFIFKIRSCCTQPITNHFRGVTIRHREDCYRIVMIIIGPILKMMFISPFMMQPCLGKSIIHFLADRNRTLIALKILYAFGEFSPGELTIIMHKTLIVQPTFPTIIPYPELVGKDIIKVSYRCSKLEEATILISSALVQSLAICTMLSAAT